MQDLLDEVSRFEEPSYPPYNIEKTGDNAYRVTMAVAGFAEGDIAITAAENTLTVKGRVAEKGAEPAYLYRGIAARAFERRFELADHIRVDSARLENGLLHVELARELPEAMKPRQIAINGKAAKLVDVKAA